MESNATDKPVPREITALLSDERLILRETQRAVTPLKPAFGFPRCPSDRHFHGLLFSCAPAVVKAGEQLPFGGLHLFGGLSVALRSSPLVQSCDGPLGLQV